MRPKPCYADGDCACTIRGDGSEERPYDITYCPYHASVPILRRYLAIWLPSRRDDHGEDCQCDECAGWRAHDSCAN